MFPPRFAKPDEKEKLQNRAVTYEPSDSRFYIVTSADQGAIPVMKPPLPSHIFLADGGVMVRRKKPICIDMPINRTRHEEMYAALLMFQPWNNESDDLGEAATSLQKCQELFVMMKDNCRMVEEELRSMVRLSWLA